MRCAALPIAVAVVAVAVVAAVAVAGAEPVAPRTTAIGFEHLLHERNIIVSGGESPACARCHPNKAGALIGRPGHAACFGACHGPAPRPGERGGDRVKLCTACHAEAAVVAPARAAPAHYPPYTLERDFAIAVGHKRHAAIACAQCHAGKQPATHARCAGCHDGGAAAGHGPAMTACSGCHASAVGAPTPPRIFHSEVNVAGAFSHARHAARGGDGARCASCHRAVLATDDNILPAPSAETCAAARCHDGAAAFPLTAACTRCHLAPTVPGFKVERPQARYSHATHDEVAQPCAACHPLTRSGEVTVVGHAPCAPCHAEDFGRREPKICGACHNGTEPWRALVADRGPPERTEFGATLDHAKHPGACESCHALTTPAVELRPPRGHRACTGKGCHAVTTGPAPRLGACESCHRRGLVLDRQVARLAAPWSVRRKFDHRTHGARAAHPCTGCHVDLGGGDVAALAAPPKSACAPCHDGTAAFKLTGTTCTRCHEGTR
jgi:c(7)-type cytochrome triheme protein